MHVPEVGNTALKLHLNALQEAGTHPLRSVCWYFTHVLLDNETQLLQATWLVVVSSELLKVLNSNRWTTGFGEPASTAATARSPVAWRSCVSV